ncbi:ABC transporter ATP-binding protein [Arsenicicoccus sp. oral taxon 190]|uniref:ABC transporter ATP-binding protein n=1 Tax=Arsenicicoccus sp. oral taxon 190 TaxID=1658671 RepID=UPI00067A35A5|nr:ABC transporter ATP-binding protein [Arsenicicoccus sp. oral taxon 190]AKT51366.1 peptide ABC transporter ATPase [Arsenicicoccus sp. oral taxon 190]
MSTSYADTAPGAAAPRDGGAAYLQVEDLSVHFPTEDGLVRSVDGLTFSLDKGRTLGIVGESGSGKSVTSQAILGLHRGTRARLGGSIRLDGRELLTMPEDELRRLRGSTMAMIFQDPLSALHPYYTVGAQIVEAIRVHHPGTSKAAAKERTKELLDRVGIPNPAKRVDQYPHEFSGGMRQRAMIAMALANDPSLLIADEPTTALDVTVQAQILDLMRDLQQEFGSAIIMITHDLGVVAEMADDVLVMYAGKAVEHGAVDDVFYHPQMPYTWGLLSSMPRLDRVRSERLVPVPGNPPSLIRVPPGCAFNPRCAYREEVSGDRCRQEVPELRDAGTNGQLVRCHLEPEQRRSLFDTTVQPRL